MQQRQSTTYTDGIRQSNANNKELNGNIFDEDVDLSLELMDILSNLQNDPDRDVLEAVEETDHLLLQNRKKNKENIGSEFLTNEDR